MPQNNSKIVSARRARIASLYLKGKPQHAIAEDVGVNQSQVSRDLKVLEGQWRASALLDINDVKMRELARINQLEVEYWDAWEESKQNYQQVTNKASGSRTRVKYKEKTTKDMILFGDPRFLAGVQWCIQKRCEIFGLNAPQKFEGRMVDEFENMSLEELAKRAGLDSPDAEIT